MEIGSCGIIKEKVKKGTHGNTKRKFEKLIEENGVRDLMVGLNLDEGKKRDLMTMKEKVIGPNKISINNLDQLGPKEFRAQGSNEKSI